MGCGSRAPRAGGFIEESPRGSRWRDVLDHWKWICMDDGGYKGCRAGTSILTRHAFSFDLTHATLPVTPQHYCPRPLTFKHTSPLLLFILAHLIEAFLYLRFYFLLPFYHILGLLGFFSGPGSRPSTAPKWLKETVFLQPTTLEYLKDVVIDDSKARKMIGWVSFSLCLCSRLL